MSTDPHDNLTEWMEMKTREIRESENRVEAEWRRASKFANKMEADAERARRLLKVNFVFLVFFLLGIVANVWLFIRLMLGGGR